MAVTKIKIASIIGRMSDLDAVTTLCGNSEVFHPDNALSFYSDTSQFTPLSEENPYAEPLQRMMEAVAASKRKLNFVSKNKQTAAQFPANIPDSNLVEYARRFSEMLQTLQRERDLVQKSIQNLTSAMAEVENFTGLDLDLDAIHECEYIKVRFGSLPKDSFDKLNLYTDNPYVIFFPSHTDDSSYWGVYFSPIDQVSEVDRIFSSLYFKRLRIPELIGTPESQLEALKKERAVDIEKIQDVDARTTALWNKEKTNCQWVYSRLLEKNTYFGIRRYAARYNDNFILTGWIPADQEESFRNGLEILESVECTFDGAEEEMAHSPPVKLKNAAPFRPFEFFVDMYGLPAYDEIDPTAFVAITYVLLFGIMFGDLGQGLVLSVIGALMWKLKKMALGKILIPCGISSAVFGLVFGSVFGMEEALNPLYKAMFGLDEKPINVMEGEMTNLIIYSAVGIGLCLVVVAILINIYSNLRRKHFESALFGPNGVAGLVFYLAVVIGFGGQLVFGWQLVTLPYVLGLIILPLLVIFFREVLGNLLERKPNWKPESWGGYITENFFEVFEFLLSYATNTMSFLRVGAFVLVHAGMMLVVFTLAEMSSGIVYVLIAIIGNVFVMCLEGLLVGIQVLRLEFYEMFSRCFDGTGRPFRPVTVRAE